jgi:hypothetical protein
MLLSFIAVLNIEHRSRENWLSPVMSLLTGKYIRMYVAYFLLLCPW